MIQELEQRKSLRYSAQGSRLNSDEKQRGANSSVKQSKEQVDVVEIVDQ